MTEIIFPFDGSLGSEESYPSDFFSPVNNIYLIEFEGYVDDIGVQTFRYCTGVGYNPPNCDFSFEPRVKNPGSFRNEMFAKGSTGGQLTTGYGEISLINLDGALDPLRLHGFDGRPVTISHGPQNGDYPDDFVVILKATMNQPTFERKLMSIKLRDKYHVFNKNLQSLKFLGNNVLPDGIEGVEDLKGSPKPLLFGTASNLTPIQVNTSKYIYAINVRDASLFDSLTDVDSIASWDSATGTVVNDTGVKITAVRDMGVALTAGAVYSSEADMLATAPAAGQYRVWEAGGYFRLGSEPEGGVTVNCTDGGYPNYSKLGQIVQHLVSDFAGLTSSEINSSDITTVNSSETAEMGYYTSNQEVTVSEVISDLCGPINAWAGFDRLGIFRLKLINTSLPTETYTLTESDIIDYELLSMAETTSGVPVKKFTFKFRKNWTVQSQSDLAGSVVEPYRTLYTKEYYISETTTNSSEEFIKLKHLLSEDMTFESLFYDIAPMTTLRQLQIYNKMRTRLKLTIKFDKAKLDLLSLGTIVKLYLNRFGCNDGVNFMILGYYLDMSSNKLELTLWR